MLNCVGKTAPRNRVPHLPNPSRPSIFFVAADSGGAGRARSRFPAQALADRGWDVQVNTHPPLPGKFDVVVIHRPYRSAHLALIRGQHKRGKWALVQEDDDLTAIASAGVDVRIKKAYTPELIRRHDTSIRESDGLIVSTSRLAEVYEGWAPRTWVVDNYLPRWIGQLRRERVHQVPIVAWGGIVPTHMGALTWLAPQAQRMVSGATFLTVGGGRETVDLLGIRSEAEAWPREQTIETYYSILAQADIGIVPLVPDEPLNLAKSSLKGKEHFALGQPVVASSTPEYRKLISHGADGFVAEAPERFADHVQELVHDPDLLARMTEGAKAKAETLWLEDHVGEWEAVFDDLRGVRTASGEGVREVQGGVLRAPVREAPRLHLLPAAAPASSMKPTPTVAVAMPCRGTMQSRTMEALFVALERAESEGKVKRVPEWWAFAHGAPIPKSHEQAAQRAMATGADLIWFIEEDNIPPPEALTASVDRMRETKAGLVAVAYPVGEPPPAGTGTRWDTVYRESGEILFTGLGITLVDRKVLEKLPRPWFRIDRQMGKDRKLSVRKPYPAGGVDVAFGLRVREQGFVLEQVPNMVGAHIRTVKAGQRPLNDSASTIEIWDSIESQQHVFRDTDSSRFTPPWSRRFAQLARQSPWVGRFQVGDEWYGNPDPGAYDPVHDPRVELCRKRFPKVKTVIELGSLEGGHTVAIARWAEQVVGIEGRPANLRKARLILEVSRVQNATLSEADLERVDLERFGTFDLCFSVGVLYHMPDPIRLLDQMRAVAPNLFLWTHVSPHDEEFDYGEKGMRDPLSGMSSISTWLPKDRLLAELGERYKKVEVLNEEPDHPAGLALTLMARQG